MGLWFALSDDESARRAGRMSCVWIWLPVFLIAAITIAGINITVDYDVKISYHVAGDPQRRTVREVKEKETDRVFGFNLHFFRGGLFFVRPNNWVETVSRRATNWNVSISEELEPFFVFLVGSPLLAALCGIVIPRALIGLRERRVLRFRKLDASKTARNTVSLMASCTGPAYWLWFVTVFLWGASEALGLSWLDDQDNPFDSIIHWMIIGALLY